MNLLTKLCQKYKTVSRLFKSEQKYKNNTNMFLYCQWLPPNKEMLYNMGCTLVFNVHIKTDFSLSKINMWKKWCQVYKVHMYGTSKIVCV